MTPNKGADRLFWQKDPAPTTQTQVGSEINNVKREKERFECRLKNKTRDQVCF
jgi:hypothetical protein